MQKLWHNLRWSQSPSLWSIPKLWRSLYCPKASYKYPFSINICLQRESFKKCINSRFSQHQHLQRFSYQGNCSSQLNPKSSVTLDFKYQMPLRTEDFEILSELKCLLNRTVHWDGSGVLKKGERSGFILKSTFRNKNCLENIAVLNVKYWASYESVKVCLSVSKGNVYCHLNNPVTSQSLISGRHFQMSCVQA